MQHCQPDKAGVVRRSLPLRSIEISTGPPHRAMMLLKSRGRFERGSKRVLRRALDRMIAPQAQIEGVDFHLTDPAVTRVAETAAEYVLVLPPLGNLSNPYYRVHPRRNDRFVAATPRLKALFPDVDFAACSFTGHALGLLAATSPERFIEVRRLLMRVWLARIQTLLARLPDTGVLIDLPSPAWLPKPPLVYSGARRVAIDPDDRVAGVEALGAALQLRAN